MRLYAKLILLIAACCALQLGLLDRATAGDIWLAMRWTLVCYRGDDAARDRLCEEVRDGLFGQARGSDADPAAAAPAAAVQ